MQPLTRQRTPASIHSWWSDSNPTGPNINLHVAAKPLMAFMYHRQASAYIRKNRSNPLSKEILEAYTSYLLFKYVSPVTKTALLWDMNKRAREEDDARVTAESLLPYLVDGLLHSTDTEVRISACLLVGSLAQHPSTKKMVLDVNPGPHIASLLRDKNLGVVHSAAIALLGLVDLPQAGRGAMDALQLGKELLESPQADVSSWTCRVLGYLAQHDDSVPTVPGANPCLRFLREFKYLDTKFEVMWNAIYALCVIARSYGGHVAVDARMVDCVVELINSGDAWVSGMACGMLERLASHASMGVHLLPEIPSLLQHTDLDVRASAVSALTKISGTRDGAAAIGVTGILAHMPDLMGSSDGEVQLQASIIVRNVERYAPGSFQVCCI
ncbi:armadillo-type protein [Mycena vulgaris]|nr:armadillo-type protein [Mycena vulgaris]KAJ6564954.1 armadillo-type protein [Mycena vulgaris]